MIPIPPRQYLQSILLAASLAIGACTDNGRKQQVDYDALDWKKGIYYLDGGPYGGSATQFHADGSVKGQWQFRHGLPHGTITEFDAAGTRITETQYRNGLRHGHNTYWDSNGERIKFQIFSEGKLLSEETAGSLERAP